jgi:intracellular septation protein A
MDETAGETPAVPPAVPPTSGPILREAGPRLLRDALGPTLCFYVGWKTEGLWLGVTMGTLFALGAYRYERRHGRPGMIARLVLVFVVLQAGVGLATHSAKAYLLQPTILGAVNGLVWLGSVAIRRPLAGVFALEVFPFDEATRRTPEFKTVFIVVSAVWGTFFLGFAAIQAAVLLTVGVDAYVALRIVDAALILTLITWSVRFVIGRLGSDPPPEPVVPFGEVAL